MSTGQTAKFTVIGCSVSSGVPAIGNDWGACNPHEPKNRRDRPCAMIETPQTRIILDTGPDFRAQMNRHNIAEIDAVIYTHAHSDHVGGIDELRIMTFRRGALIDVYGNKETLDALKSRYEYMFKDVGGYRRTIKATPITLYEPQTIGDIEFTGFEQDHGDVSSLGFRFGNIGYSVDMRFIDERGLNILRGIDTWIVDGAGHRKTDHPTHAPIERVIEMNNIVGASKVYIIGLSKFMDYKTINDSLPAGFECGYDDLSVSVTF